MKLGNPWIISFVASLFATRFVVGLFISLSGPTLLYLAENVDASVEQISSMFSGRSSGFFFGTAAFGVTMNRLKSFQPLKVIGFNAIIVGLLICAIPWVRNLGGVVVIFTLVGLIMGFTDAGCQSLFLRYWGDASRPYIQAYHLCAGIGGLVSPLLARPFLERASQQSGKATNDRCAPHGDKITSTTISYNESSTVITPMPEYTGVNPVSWTYVLCGTFSFFAGLCIFILAICHVEHHVKRKQAMTIEKREEEPIGNVIGLFIPVLLFYFGAASSMLVYQGYIYSVAVCSSLAFSISDALWLTNLFWIGFASTRFVGIFLSKRFLPSTVITVNLTCGSITIVLLCVFGRYIPTVLWITTFLFGFFYASLYPTGVSWTSRVTNVSSTYILIFGLGNTVGQSSMAPLAGVLFEIHPFNVLYLIGGIAVLIDIAFIWMTLVGRRHTNRLKEMKEQSKKEKDEKNRKEVWSTSLA